MLSGGAEEVFQGQTLAKRERCIGFSEILEQRWKVPNKGERTVWNQVRDLSEYSKAEAHHHR